jgi:hypothetical protein
MPIVVACECGKSFQAPDEDAGTRAVCPFCGREQTVPKPAYMADDLFAGMVSRDVRSSGKAIASMILGFTSFCCSILTGVPAIILGVLGLVEIDGSKGHLKGRGMAITGIVTGALGCTLVFMGVLLALLLPAVQAAREAARRAQCSNNLKQIGLAMHNYASTEDHFPAAAITDKQGKPLLSWRVAILPYIEQQELYNQFHLDEPWDSPHNSALLPRRPATYACPSFAELSKDPTLTTYQALVGPGTAFENPNGPTVVDIPDGLASTLFVVEALNAVLGPSRKTCPTTPTVRCRPGAAGTLVVSTRCSATARCDS